MTTLAGIVASVVVHSSAAALSHFGLTLAPMAADKPVAHPVRAVARSQSAPQKIVDCPARIAHPTVRRI